MSVSIKDLAKDSPVAIFGTGSSGACAKKLLDSLGISSVYYAEAGTKHAGAIDGKDLEPFSEKKAELHKLVVYSPAFRPDHPWILAAQKAGARTICEPDLAALAWRGKIVAITGTDGKTTTTSFLTLALNREGFDAIAAGNIGEPLSGFCAKFSGEGKIAVCELSSFQCAALKYLRPDALIWTNFAPDHLDWHRDLREYFSAKLNLMNALKGDMFFAGSSVKEYAEEFGVKLPDFAKILDEKNPPPAPAPFDNSIQAQNYAAATAFAQAFGLRKDALSDAAKEFKLPAFRFSKFEEVGRARFFNDSKATNAHSAIAALEELKGEKNLVWLGGGKDKYCDLTALVDTVSKRAKGAVLIGQTAEKLANALDGKLPLGAKIRPDMESAVKTAYEMVENGGSVLFSPAFSSFGMFSGYADRGKSFESAVLCLKNFKEQ